MNFTDCSEVALPRALLRPLGVADLPAYKALRDSMLRSHPEAFTSDAAAEGDKVPEVLMPRLGLGHGNGGQFVLGAFEQGRLVGTVACERDLREKVRHVAQVVGLMVRPACAGRGIGRALLAACIERARQVPGLEQLTLSVAASNLPALRLYRSAGFVRYGLQPRALRVGDRYHDKELMLLEFASSGIRHR